MTPPDGSTFDAATENWLDRLLEKAPPLSQRQQDVIAAVFRGEITEKPARARKAGAA